MNKYSFSLMGANLVALPSGALWWPERGILCVSDMHLGKSDRIARRRGSMLPPYEVRDTLTRLEAAIADTKPQTIVCLGDSFDDLNAQISLQDSEVQWITRLQAGRSWVWIEGNHDPGPIEFGGTHLAEFKEGPLRFCHIATPAGRGEISGHYHPKTSIKAKDRTISRPSFLVDDQRVIMPAFGTFTGGLRDSATPLQALMSETAIAVLTGTRTTVVPMQRH